MIPSRPLTEKEAREMAHVYHMTLDLAVKIELTLNKAQKEHLVQLLLAACAEADECELLLRSVINYVRASE